MSSEAERDRKSGPSARRRRRGPVPDGGASSSGKTLDFGSSTGGSNPPAPTRTGGGTKRGMNMSRSAGDSDLKVFSGSAHPALAAELVRHKVDVIVTAGPLPTRGAKEATSTIPIVMAQDPDPVGNGFVTSLAQPGGNITGLSAVASELSGKRLELLKEILPSLSRVAIFGTSTYPGNAQALKEIEFAAKGFGVRLQHLDVLDFKDIETAFRAASKGRADAVLALGNSVLNAHRTQVADLAVMSRLPAMYYAAEFVEAGGLMFYGVDFADLFRRAAVFVDKILKGAKPADLPVEQPTKFEFGINLKAAKQIGLTIPPNVLARADRVIK